LRYYERIGLLPRVRRSANGYRDYPPDIQNRIRVIRNAVELGFPLKEIASVLRVRDAGGTPCRQVRDYALTVVQQLEGRIREMKGERRALLAMIDQWNSRLVAAGDGARAHLLEMPRSKPARTPASKSR
jgi:DNA-binding transcriptional MerR regulator